MVGILEMEALGGRSRQLRRIFSCRRGGVVLTGYIGKEMHV